jgi:hypothetical protein
VNDRHYAHDYALIKDVQAAEASHATIATEPPCDRNELGVFLTSKVLDE